MSTENRKIISITTEVTVYPSSKKGPYLFSIPEEVLQALRMPKDVYVVLRDIFGNLIHHRHIKRVSGPEVNKGNFKDQIANGQLYPGQRIRLEVSLL